MAIKMKQTSKTLSRLALATLLLVTSGAWASESASKESGGAAYAKLDTFTVNLQGLTQYLQASITLKLADPKTEELIKMNMPIIRHELLLLLSSKAAGQISSFEGKQKLMDETRHTVNKVIGKTDEKGVTGALFESFIIQ